MGWNLQRLYPSISGDGTNIAYMSIGEIFLINSEYIVDHELTIETIGSGTTTPEVGTHRYNEGVETSVSAIEDVGWAFDHWLLDSVNVGSANPYLITMDEDHSLTTVFSELPPPPLGKYYLNLDVNGSGSTSPATGSNIYDENTKVNVTATASAGWTFDYWLLDSENIGANNPYEVTLNSNHNLIAVFREGVDPYSSPLDELFPSRDVIPSEYRLDVGYNNVTLDEEGFLEGRTISYFKLHSIEGVVTLDLSIYKFSNRESAISYYNKIVEAKKLAGGYTEIAMSEGFAMIEDFGTIERGYSWSVANDMVLYVYMVDTSIVGNPAQELSLISILWNNEIPEFSLWVLVSIFLIASLIITIFRKNFFKK